MEPTSTRIMWSTIESTLGFSYPAQTRNATLFISMDSYISLVYGHLYQWPENLRLILTVSRFFFCLLCTQYRTHGQVSCLLPCSHIRTAQGGRGDLADRTNMTSDGFIECTQDLTNLFSSVLEGLPLKMAKFISELYRAKKTIRGSGCGKQSFY